MKCKTCRFWQHINDETWGLCRRYAPRAQLVIVVPEEGTSEPKTPEPKTPEPFPLWPQTYGETDWCGEHQGRQGAD